MSPLFYEKAILRSFVPTWRETLIFYLKNGSLDKNKNQSLVDRLGTSSKIESEFQNGLIIVSSGIDLNRLLFYLLFYIANPLHVYEFDRFSENYKGNVNGEHDLNDQLIKDCENLLENEKGEKRPIKNVSENKKVKKNKYEISENVKREYEAEASETDQFEEESEDERILKIDDIYDCPSLSIKNSKLSIKSNNVYRKIFSMSEPVRRSKIWERLFLFKDVNIQSTVTMYTHLVFILGFELSDFDNYTDAYKRLKSKLFVGKREEKDEQEEENKENDQSLLRLPKLEFIDGNVLSSARQQLYVNGGCFCINSRILLNDILSGKILPEIVGGVVVMNAHQILEDYNIAFVVRLLRMRNKVAFVKAISNSVHSFKGNNLNFILKNIFTKNVHMYPRFHQAIESVLNDEQVQPLTFEVSMGLSENATAVYKSILRILWTVVESMKRLKFDIDMNKVVYASIRGLIKLLNKQVNSTNVYQMYINTTSGGSSTNTGSSSPQANSTNYYIDTLLKFRTLLDNLLYMDPVSFVEQLERIKTETSNWVCTPNGIKMFRKSNERLFKIDNESVELNIEKNMKYEYIKKIFETKITNEQLVQIIKNNFKFQYENRKKYMKYRFGGGSWRQNMSNGGKRRRLVNIESRHLSYLTNFFKKGKKLRRNILIIVENYYLVEYLTRYCKYDVHMSKLLQLIQMNMIRDVTLSEELSSNMNKGSFSKEYYSNINKDILDQNNIFNLYKTLIKTKENNMEMSGDSSYSNTQGSNTNEKDNKDEKENKVNALDEEKEDIINNILKRLAEGESQDKQKERQEEEKRNEEELVDYMDINVDFDDYVFNSINIIRSYSNTTGGKIDKYDRLMSTLQKLNPCIAVIYAPNVHLFRIIENYCALKFSRIRSYRKKLNFLQVHVLSYKDCLETHRFTKGLKSEMEAWSKVQMQKNSLVVRMDEAVLLNKTNVAGNVIVDSRELNSKLPFFLFNMGIQVVPTVLEIGDYLITRDLCIERKSLGDLMSSLNSTRLSKQLSEMCSAYANPFLLIEFDENEKFHLSSIGESKYGHNYIYTKLLILCVNFPKLRLIWSSSPQESAKIIKHLKANRSEPDLITNEYLIKNFRNKSEKLSLTNRSETEDEERLETVGLRRPEFVKNRDALKILRNIPGVTTHNLSQILTKAKSLLHLSEFSLMDLCNFLPEHEARQIHDYFNMPINSS